MAALIPAGEGRAVRRPLARRRARRGLAGATRSRARSALPPRGGAASPGLSQEASSLKRDSLPDAMRLSNLLLISAAVVSKLSGGERRKQAVSLKFKWIQRTQ